MKSVFIIITDMGSGGAQRSLLSFLKCLEATGNHEKYSIDLMVVHPIGIFYDQIPTYVNMIKPDRSVIWMGVGFKEVYLKDNFSLLGLFGKMKSFFDKKLGSSAKTLNSEQQLWSSWKGLIPNNKKQYDVAISYLNGYPNYYVMDKVVAEKKVLWIHNEYQKLNYDREFDIRYYHDCDEIITISQECVNSFLEIFPDLGKKISILENISVSSEIIVKSRLYIPDELVGVNRLKLVSVGRLTDQKGFDIAIDAAKLIKRKIPDFLWIILGDGPDYSVLTEQIIKNEVQENVKLIGIKDNPYVYIKNADIFVQTSRYEGKSIVLDETKLLLKPIVVTKYPTVLDSIEDGVTGSIVEISPEGIAEGIISLAENKERQKYYINNLEATNKGNEKEISKYISIML